MWASVHNKLATQKENMHSKVTKLIGVYSKVKIGALIY